MCYMLRSYAQQQNIPHHVLHVCVCVRVLYTYTLIYYVCTHISVYVYIIYDVCI